MSQVDQRQIELFTRKAEAASAVVKRIYSLAEAYAYAVDVCVNKDACLLLLSGCENAISNEASDRCVAAPKLADDQSAELARAAEKAGMKLIADGLRSHLARIDIGFTVADLGLAKNRQSGSGLLLRRSAPGPP